MLNKLKEKNPGIAFYSVEDAAFAPFGRVVRDFDASPILEAAKKIAVPAQGSAYVATEPTFEALETAAHIRDRFYGELPTQVGYCWGYNTMLNATEWHTGSEINIAVTPLVLLLGHLWDVKDGKIDASAFKAFYVPAGSVLEVYATSLHYCPCQVQDGGFGCVVALPAGTNTPMERPAEDRLLFQKNKWLIAHEGNGELIAKGVFGGISGINYDIQY